MRAITFPKTADGEWTNRETGVYVHRMPGGTYEIRQPSGNVVGWAHVAYRGTLCHAREVATLATEQIRERIAAAYDEAVESDRRRTAEAANADALWSRRQTVEAAGTDALIDGAHAESPYAYFQENQSGGKCTRASDWTGEHLFEDNEIELNSEGYDEFERCGRPACDPIHVEGAHAAALREADRRIADEQVKKLGWIDRVKAFRARTGCGLREAMIGVRDEAHAEALQENLGRWLTAGPPCTPECKKPNSSERHLPDCPGSAYAVAGSAGESLLVHPDHGFGARWPEDAGRICWVGEAHNQALREEYVRALASVQHAVLTREQLDEGIPAGAQFTASAWTGAAPIRTDPDGAQHYGPYPATVKPVTSWHIDGVLTEPQPEDIVRINRTGVQGKPNRYFTEWKVLEFAADRKRVRVDLVAGSLLGPQWEDWSSLELIRRPGVGGVDIPAPRFPEGTPEYALYRAELKTELDKFAAGETPYEYGTMPAEQGWLRAERGQTNAGKSRETAAAFIAGVRAGMQPQVAGKGAFPGLPPVPDDVDDDEAWAAYCAAVPEPTEAEHQATARDFGPYAVERAAAVQAFRECARDYWTIRRGERTKLHEAGLRSLRLSMNTIAGAVRVYDQLTESWRVGEQADSARDAFVSDGGASR